ncbi:MAG: hypothetical protein KDI01_09620 [Halioglobus sp.]|nr:hypothetical protein [Halioglobus sp.]
MWRTAPDALFLPVAAACAVLLCCAAAVNGDDMVPSRSPAAEDTMAQASRYQRSVRALRSAPPAQLADFAVIALEELAEVYMAEADLARREALALDADTKLAGWARAVDRYAGQLMAVREDIDLGMPVHLYRLREGDVGLRVAGRAVLLNHPRPDQQAAYEQRVLMVYCARHECADAAADAPSGNPLPVSPTPVRPDWTFSNDGAQCAHGGIAVRFADAAGLPRYRAICEQLLLEAQTLADEITWQQAHGVVIQWDALAIRATPGRVQHIVQLNARGDVILGALPLFNSSPAVLRDLAPWLRSRAAGRAPPGLELDAAHYGWETAAKAEAPDKKPDIY